MKFHAKWMRLQESGYSRRQHEIPTIKYTGQGGLLPSFYILESSDTLLAPYIILYVYI